VQPLLAPADDTAELEQVIAKLVPEPAAGLVVMPDIFTVVHRDRIISLANRYRVPAIYPYRYFAAGGGLMSYGQTAGDLLDQYRRAAPDHV
jgi:putative tryptophan/tyrosine transport system substrate-binding protein